MLRESAIDDDGPSARVYAALFVAATLLFVCVGLIVEHWMDGFTARDTGGDAIAGYTRNHADVLASAAFIAMLPLALAATPWRRSFGTALPAPIPVVRTIAATALVVAIQTGVGLIAAWTADDSSVAETYSDFTTASKAVTAISAAITEETLNIVTPVAVALAVLVATRRVRVHRKESVTASVAHVTTAPRTWPICIAACAVGLITRIADHLYQGPERAAAAAIWGAGLLAVYAVYRSIVPLMIGHFVYDFVVAGVLPIRSWAAAAVYLGGACVIAAAAITCSRSRARLH